MPRTAVFALMLSIAVLSLCATALLEDAAFGDDAEFQSRVANWARTEAGPWVAEFSEQQHDAITGWTSDAKAGCGYCVGMLQSDPPVSNTEPEDPLQTTEPISVELNSDKAKVVTESKEILRIFSPSLPNSASSRNSAESVRTACAAHSRQIRERLERALGYIPGVIINVRSTVTNAPRGAEHTIEFQPSNQHQGGVRHENLSAEHAAQICVRSVTVQIPSAYYAALARSQSTDEIDQIRTGESVRIRSIIENIVAFDAKPSSGNAGVSMVISEYQLLDDSLAGSPLAANAFGASVGSPMFVRGLLLMFGVAIFILCWLLLSGGATRAERYLAIWRRGETRDPLSDSTTDGQRRAA